MAFVASLLAYLVTVVGISVSLVMLGCAVLAPQALSTFNPHGRVAAVAQIEPPQRPAPRLTPSIHSGQRPRNSARISDNTIVPRARGVSKEHIATLLRQRSRQMVSRACLSGWTLRCAPNAFSSRRMSYAQDASIGFSRIR